MKLSYDHPDSFRVESILLDGEPVWAERVDTEEGFADIYVDASGDPWLGGARVSLRDPPVERRYGRVEVYFRPRENCPGCGGSGEVPLFTSLQRCECTTETR